jgi:hypothetical protein
MSKEITKKEDVQVTPITSSTDSFITQALASNASVEVLTQLFQLQKDVKAEQAREAYVVAMAKFQAICPVIEKKKPVKNKNGQIVYFYAPLDSIVEQVKKPLSESDLSYNFEVRKDAEFLTVVCNVTHKLGHKETSEFMVPIGTEAYMTEPQKYGARATFAKRNAFCNALGILTGDEDTDATQTEKEKAPVDVKSKIVFLLKTLSYNTESKESIKNAVIALTQLELVEANFTEIVNRLEVLVSERNEDKSKE